MNLHSESAGFIFHHVGMAVSDVDASTRALAVLGFSPDPMMPDALEEQYGVRLRFLTCAKLRPMLELVAPTRTDSAVSDLLIQRGVGLYHSCFEVPSLHAAIETLARNGFRRVGQALRATAFRGRQIQFLHHPAAGLIELLEAEPLPSRTNDARP